MHRLPVPLRIPVHHPPPRLLHLVLVGDALLEEEALVHGRLGVGLGGVLLGRLEAQRQLLQPLVQRLQLPGQGPLAAAPADREDKARAAEVRSSPAGSAKGMIPVR